MLIETDRIILRRWQESDRLPFAQMNADPRVIEFLGPPLTPQDSSAAVDKQIALTQNGAPAFWAAARKSDNQFIGAIGVKTVNFDAPFTPCYEIGWRLAFEHWGQGYATEGAKAALQLAFRDWDMPAIYSFTVPANIRSQAIMQKIGMHRIKDGDFDHPNLAKTDPLCRHILYRIDRAARPIAPR